MALTLPYPTYTPFAADTVHSFTAHNTPHAGLLSNDNAIKDYLDNTIDPAIAALQAVPPSAIVRITPVQLYLANNTGIATENGTPPAWSPATTHNTGDIRVWKTLTYPVTVPTGVGSILIQLVAMSMSSSAAYISVKSTSVPEFVGVYSRSRANSDDNASDTSMIELPYEAGRSFDIYFNALSTYVVIVNVLGYRT
jgi:hypothetical protein